MTDTFHAVGMFHGKFDLPTTWSTPPTHLDDNALRFRTGFLMEELEEFCEATGLCNLADALCDLRSRLQTGGDPLAGIQHASQNLEKAGDALVDLKYVTDGTAHMMGLPFNEMFEEVQRANMAKERATSADDARSLRKNSLDVVKPAGWRPPDHGPIIARHAAAFSQ